MAIAFNCPGCGQAYQVPEAMAGRATRCKQCNTSVTVPLASEAGGGAAAGTPDFATLHARSRKVALWTCILLGVFGVLPGLALGVFGMLFGGGGATYKTPEEVFKVAQTALEKEDWKTFSSCLTDDSRDEMAGMMVMGSMMMKAFAGLGGDDAKAQVQAVDAVMAKHGLTEEVLKKLEPEKGPPGEPPSKDGLKKLTEPIKDKNAFVADMMGVMKNSGKKGPGKGPRLPQGGELKDLKVTGDTASGVIVSMQDGMERRDPVEFRKVGGGWKIQMPSASGPPMG